MTYFLGGGPKKTAAAVPDETVLPPPITTTSPGEIADKIEADCGLRLGKDGALHLIRITPEALKVMLLALRQLQIVLNMANGIERMDNEKSSIVATRSKALLDSMREILPQE